MSIIEKYLETCNGVLIVHHSDLDGIASAAVVLEAIREVDTDFSSDVYFMPYNYENTTDQMNIVNHAIDVKRLIIIVDVSLYGTNLETTFKALTSVDSKIACIWIDHHQSSMDSMTSAKHIYCSEHVVDTSRCGAYLAYQFFFPEKNIPPVIKLVDDHDRWIHKFDPGYLNTVFEMNDSDLRDPSSVTWCRLIHDEMSVDLLGDLISRGKAAYEVRQHVNTEYRKRTGKIVVFEFKVDGIAKNSISVNTMNGVGNSSLFGDDIYKIANTAMRYNIGWVDMEPIASITFYSSEDGIKCNELASVFGGGGHPHAAGCRMPLKDFILNKVDSESAYIPYFGNNIGLTEVPKIVINVSKTQYDRIFG